MDPLNAVLTIAAVILGVFLRHKGIVLGPPPAPRPDGGPGPQPAPPPGPLLPHHPLLSRILQLLQEALARREERQARVQARELLREIDRDGDGIPDAPAKEGSPHAG